MERGATTQPDWDCAHYVNGRPALLPAFRWQWARSYIGNSGSAFVPWTDGARLQRARRDAGLTQAALADAIGASRSTVARWEIEETGPAPQFLTKLRRVLDLPDLGAGRLAA